MAKKSDCKNWMKERRQERFEQIKFRYYIFCEGEKTEPNYFKGFKCRKTFYISQNRCFSCKLKQVLAETI